MRPPPRRKAEAYRPCLPHILSQRIRWRDADETGREMAGGARRNGRGADRVRGGRGNRPVPTGGGRGGGAFFRGFFSLTVIVKDSPARMGFGSTIHWEIYTTGSAVGVLTTGDVVFTGSLETPSVMVTYRVWVKAMASPASV